MLMLSNGQTITLSSERARYHATRRNIRIDRHSPHRDLYALIDVLVWRSQDRYSYVYSGNTLAEFTRLDMLAEADRRSINRWLLESHIRYEIEGARRRLIYDTLPAAVVTQDYPQRLFSRLRQLVASMPVNTMPSGQWRQTLVNLQQQGISREELYWSGVLAWLDKAGQSAKPKISKQTVLDNIDFSRLRLRLSYELLEDKGAGKTIYCNKFQHISLHGGEDYREWLVTLPDYIQSYFGPHYTERNVLLHIRTKTRSDSQGRRLLFIEEIQSDWHQVTYKNRSTLSKVQAPLAPYHRSWVSLGLKLMLCHVAKKGFSGIAWADGLTQASRYGAGLVAVQRIYDDTIPKSLLKLSKHWGGEIATSKIKTKVPWFRIEAAKNQTGMAAKHAGIKSSKYSRQDIVSMLSVYRKSEFIQVPVFILPEGMPEDINKNGLPLFGENILK